MTWVNLDDVISQLEGAGLVIERSRLQFDSRVQRWMVTNEDHERRGWTRLKEWTSKSGNTYVVGSYGIWHGNDDGYTRIDMPRKDDNRPALTDEDKAAIRAAQAEAARQVKKLREAEAKTAGRWAASVWNLCEPCTDHEYLTRKQIKPHGIKVMGEVSGEQIDALDDSNRYRLRDAAGALVVPMHDANGNVCGLQFIYPTAHPRKKKIERDKEFWPTGMAMGGTFGMIGYLNRTGILLVTEGYATAASLHEATGLPVAYAFSANNLAKAGKLLRKSNPKLRMLFCADDDYLTAGNPGVTAAVNATAEIELTAWIKPDFNDADGNDLRGGKKLTDFNDLAVLSGLPITLANQVNAKLDALAWRDAARVEPVNGGAGDGGRRSAVSVMSMDDAVERFVPLDDGTGKYLFDRWTRKIAHRDQMAALLPPGARGDDIKRHPVWIRRGAYYMDEVGFDPTEHDKTVKLNTWKGWPLQPVAGKCEKMLEALMWLCSNEGHGNEIYHYLLRWMAYPLQHPGAKMSSAVIMHGPQGTGKSAIFQSLAKIYGDYATILNQRGLEDKFNSDWADSKLFILAEEVVTRAEMWHIKNELKELVTGEWIRVNPKNIAAYRQRNQVNIVYLSNESQPLPIENDDRRHLVIYTPPPLSEEFYDDLWQEIDNGGVAAFYDYLLQLDLGYFHPKKRPPSTEAKNDLIRLSLPSDVRFIHDWQDGEVGGLPFCPCLGNHLYIAYRKYCDQEGERNPRSRTQFINMVGKTTGWRAGKSVPTREAWVPGSASVNRKMVIPPDDLLTRKSKRGKAGETWAQPPAQTQAEWLAECFFAFKEALGVDE